jgi:hypothetical protein
MELTGDAPTPLGNVTGDQVPPALVVSTIAPPEEFRPLAKQVDEVGHAMLSRDSMPEGTLWLFQVVPPSVVWSITPVAALPAPSLLGTEVDPTARQSFEEVHATSSSCGTPLVGLESMNQELALVVETAVFVPTETQSVVDVHEIELSDAASPLSTRPSVHDAPALVVETTAPRLSLSPTARHLVVEGQAIPLRVPSGPERGSLLHDVPLLVAMMSAPY